jgi:hypothetical protein
MSISAVMLVVTAILGAGLDSGSSYLAPVAKTSTSVGASFPHLQEVTRFRSISPRGGTWPTSRKARPN